MGLNMTLYTLYEVTPAPHGYDYRIIKSFDRLTFAKRIKNALEKVNIDFSLYRIIGYNSVGVTYDSFNILEIEA